MVRNFRAALDDDARIRAKQVDTPEHPLGVVDQADDVRFPGNVGGNRHSTDLVGHFSGALRVAIGNNHRTRPFFGEALGESAADAAGRARNHDDLISKLHDCRKKRVPMRAEALLTLGRSLLVRG